MKEMKKYISYILPVVAAVVLEGCSKRPMEGLDDGKYPVQFSCDVLSEEDRSDTKVTSDRFDAGDMIGMFSYPSNGPMFGQGEFIKGNVLYVYRDGGALQVAEGWTPLYFPSDAAISMTFKGYYPHSNQMTTYGVLAVDLADQRSGATNEILYSDNAKQIGRTAEYVKLQFEYVMAQVILNIQYDPATMPNGNVASISAVTLEGNGVYDKCDFHVENGTVTAAAGSAARGTIGLKPGGATTVATVMPGTVLDLAVTVVTPAHTYVARPRNITYERGRQYTYNITLKDGGEVQIGEASILEWEPGNDPNNEPPIIGELGGNRREIEK